jgi:hypothetical protein
MARTLAAWMGRGAYAGRVFACSRLARKLSARLSADGAWQAAHVGARSGVDGAWHVNPARVRAWRGVLARVGACWRMGEKPA